MTPAAPGAHNYRMRNPNSTEKCHNIFESTQCAASGFLTAVLAESKVRTVVLFMIVVSLVCGFADVGYFQILMVLFGWVLALICEMFNTALEKALDYASGKEYHPLIRQGKDYAAACTFIALIFASLLTLFVLYERVKPDRNPDRAIEFRDSQR